VNLKAAEGGPTDPQPAT